MPEPAWSPPPAAHPPLEDGTVHVWRADLARASDAGPGPLSPGERERAARFADPANGRRWACARGILRALLGAYAGADPAVLAFAEGAHGKPALTGSGAASAPPRLRFNLSHSGDVALYAVALGREVGIDVELPRRPVDAVAIAAKALGAATAERLRTLPPEEREREFLRAWVRWEAVLKCRGTGIGGAEEPADGPEPWVRELDLEQPGAAALAVAGGQPVLRCWRWPAPPR